MTLQTRPLMNFEVDVGKPVTIDASGTGRRYIPITGGRVTGEWMGKVVPGGADWQVIWPDGRLDLEAHYAIDLDGHGLVEVLSQGVRHGPPDVLAALARGEPVEPSRYYFRTSMRFRTAAPGLLRLNSIIAIASGARQASVVKLAVHEIL
jgi:hypothetical protein